MEIFKDIPGYEGIYTASNFGNIKSLGNLLYKKEKIMKPFNDGRGYLKVKLSNGNKRKSFFLHRLVMMAFDGISELEVNHINHNTKDNRLENLEYVTKQINIEKRRPYRVICCPNCNTTFNYRKSPIPK